MLKHVRFSGFLAFNVPSFDDEDGLFPDSVEEVEETTDGTANDHFNNRTLQVLYHVTYDREYLNKLNT